VEKIDMLNTNTSSRYVRLAGLARWLNRHGKKT
jgi:hypothetical protein